MDKSEFLAALRRDGTEFREAVASVDLDAPVPPCPGWTVRDLVWHLDEAHYFWAAIVSQRATSWDQVVRIDQVPDEHLLAHYDQSFAQVLAVLSETDPSVEVWSWSAQHDVAFVIRRMAHETAVHRWDADQVAGLVSIIDPVLASDGIDEFLEHFLDDVADGAESVGGSVHIHCADTPGEWTIRPRNDGYDVTREHAKGDCALRGDASNLLLSLWRRVGPDAIDVVGDAGVAARFLLATNLD